MFFFLLYCGVGTYLLLIAAGVLHKELLKPPARPRPGDPAPTDGPQGGSPQSGPGARRLGIIALGAGLCVLGLYYGWHAYFFSTPAGKDYQRLQRDMQRRAMQGRSSPPVRRPVPKGDAETGSGSR